MEASSVRGVLSWVGGSVYVWWWGRGGAFSGDPKAPEYIDGNVRYPAGGSIGAVA